MKITVSPVPVTALARLSLLTLVLLLVAGPTSAESGAYRVEVLVFRYLESMAEPRESEELRRFEEGWRLILTASLANLVFKAGVVGLIGHRRLLGKIAMLFSIPLVGGLLLIFLWPW